MVWLFTVGEMHTRNVEEILETELFWILCSAAIQWEIKFGILVQIIHISQGLAF